MTKKMNSPKPVRIDIMFQEFGKIGVDNNDCITEKFFHFPIGTHREDVWHWFEEIDSKFSIGKAINEGIIEHE